MTTKTVIDGILDTARLLDPSLSNNRERCIAEVAFLAGKKEGIEEAVSAINRNVKPIERIAIALESIEKNFTYIEKHTRRF